jgi:quinohemoprotein ethanol dehydrogenase
VSLIYRALLTSCVVCFVGWSNLRAQDTPARNALDAIDDKALQNVESRPGQWLSHGRDAGETRFSPLVEIDADNVGNLGLAWSYETGTSRGLEATPLIVDGVMYTTGSWSIVYAIDARTGKEIWKYDPKVEGKYGGRACCDVVNRGVAVYKGKVYVGVLDGRLVALDGNTGKPVWEVVTVDQDRPYTITAAPRVAAGNIIIGNGGAEYGVRGYVSAYNAQSGELAWRFYTVPGNPADPFESAALEKAAETWKGKWWEVGGGGTVWDSIAYDPELNLVYAGVGNGSPWNPHLRSDGESDNLYLSSVIALNADSGKLAWHYQTTPGDAWDYTATQHMILTELNIKGRQRKVLMQAPKNGFFYLLDRETGELLSAEPYVKVTWAEGIDKATGRPIEAPGMRYKDAGIVVVPGPLGGHNWQPMSFSPKTGLVYIPAQDNSMFYSQQKDFVYRPGTWNTGIDFAANAGTPEEPPSGFLLAWDPVKQQARWRVQHNLMWNGGTLATAGDLVFQGSAEGTFAAYHAANGKRLWEVNVGSGIIATPVTYQIDGVQYVSIMAGWGGAGATTGGAGANAPGRLLTFVLSGTQKLAAIAQDTSHLDVTRIETDGDEAAAARGAQQYARNCAVCHGFNAMGTGVIADVRLSDEAMFDEYEGILLDGDMTDSGMPSFKRWLNKQDVADIRHYIATMRNALVKD